MKKRDGKKLLRELKSLKVLPKKANRSLQKEVNKHLKKSIKTSKKKIEQNKKFGSLTITKEYLDIKLRLYSERKSVLNSVIPL